MDGIGNAQRGEVEWMRRRGVAMYAYGAEEYMELCAMAQLKRRLPEERLWHPTKNIDIVFRGDLCAMMEPEAVAFKYAVKSKVARTPFLLCSFFFFFRFFFRVF